MTLQKRVCFVLAGLFALAATNGAAYTVQDPTPAMKWDDMPKCGLVVDAVYDKSTDTTLSLKIVRVLKGGGTKPGEVISVSIENWYSVTPEEQATGKNGEALLLPPKLNRKSGSSWNPQGVDAPETYIDDLRKPAVYFFPAADKLALAQMGQVQEARFADDWANLIAGKPTDVYFRIVQKISLDISHTALEELRRTRDAAAIEKLLGWTSDLTNMYEFQEADRWMAALGDKNGDVFDPLLKRFDDEKTIDGIRYEIAMSMSKVDLKRTEKELLKRAADGPWKDSATMELRWVPTEDSMNFLLDRLLAGDRPEMMLTALESILHLYEPGRVTPDESDSDLAHLRELSKPKLIALLASGKLDAKVKDEIEAKFTYLHSAP